MFVSQGFDDIADVQLAASPGFNLAVHSDVAVLNDIFRLTARLNNAMELQKLIQPNRIGVLIDVIHLQSSSDVLGFPRQRQNIVALSFSFLNLAAPN
jgi:hypothetical protein